MIVEEFGKNKTKNELIKNVKRRKNSSQKESERSSANGFNRSGAAEVTCNYKN